MGTVPFSNPAGNNQMTPKMGGLGAPNPVTQGNIPGAPGAVNPLPGARPMAASVPLGGTMPPNPAAPSIPNVGGLTNSPSNVAGTTGGLDKQLTDIWGKGVGGALASLLGGMSGTDSQILQEYIASLGPQMATAQANTNAALGAGGVSANSSVAAIADANLQSQEFAAISGESAKLTQSQEDLTAQILMGLSGPAQKQVATSGWSVFGDVMNQITGDVGDLVGGSYTTKGNSPGGASSPSLAVDQAQPSNMPQEDLSSTVPSDPSIAYESMLPFGG
jgi:hypothetical protein